MTRSQLRIFRVAFAAWLLGIFAFFVPAATWNPVSRFNLTRAIVENGTLAVDPFVTSTGDRANVKGRWYSDKAPVPALLAVPPYALIHAIQNLRGIAPEFRAFSTTRMPAVRVKVNQAYQQGLYVCSVLTSGLAGVALALLVFELARRRTSSRAALIGTTLVMLGTPILPYATSFYGHVIAAAFVAGAIYCLDTRGLPRTARTPTPGRVRIAGACLALAPGCEYLTAFPAALVGAWYLVRARGRRLDTMRDFAAGALLPVLIVAGYHWLVFGAPWRTGYSFETQPEFVAGHATGLLGLHLPRLEGVYGLTLSVRRGLFYMAPVAVPAAAYAVYHAVRRRDWAIGAGLSVLGFLLLLNAGYYMWWGGAAAGPRHLVPGLGFLAIGIARAWQTGKRWLLLAIVVLGAVSIVNFTATTAVGIETPETGNVLREFVYPRLLDGKVAALSGASNLGLKIGLPGIASLLPLVLWGALGYWYLASGMVRRYPTERRRRTETGPGRRSPELGTTTPHASDSL